jgi:predicted nucleic acid-binding protein
MRRKRKEFGVISILPPRKGNLLNLLKEIEPMDTLLAAHALSIGATVVTGNMREFARVPGLAASHNWCICCLAGHYWK